MNRKAKVLVIEDEERLARLLSVELKHEGYDVAITESGLKGVELASCYMPDVIILDLMLPDIDGFKVAKRIRSKLDTPIIMLTARDTVYDKILGFECGADDYVTKPFVTEVLFARIRAAIRRRSILAPGESLEFSDLKLDTSTCEVHRGGRTVHLTVKEFALLELFLRHPKQVLSKQTIFDQVWGYDYMGESNVVEVYMKYLRDKIDCDEEKKLLHTVRGFGYVLKEIQ
ncbi:MAG: response regulator transcription factor [Chloroflexi bacterium]|nr:response regulator transcription factor [Chloroflexota bacterium]